VASTGGQLTPPILGAAAFVMAESLGINYWEVVQASVLPALLFYLAIYMTVHLLAVRTNLAMMSPEDGTDLRSIFSLQKLLPLVLGVGLLTFGVMRGNSIVYAVFLGVMGLLVAYLLIHVRDLETLKSSLLHLGSSLVVTAKGVVLVGILLAGAQILVALLNLTGLSVAASSLILDAAGNNLFLMSGVTAVICLFMGMGLPTLPAYVLVAAIMCPAMAAALKLHLSPEHIALGIHGIATHMFVFYYACLSALTPPVCAAVFVASGISGESWLSTAREAMRLGAVTYLLPFLFIFYPGMTGLGGVSAIALAAASGLAIVICFAYIFGGTTVTGYRAVDIVLFLGIVYMAVLTSAVATYAALACAVGMALIGKKRFPRSYYQQLAVEA